ncbi:MAG: peptide chain release factor N(5)-glutamine methyltransferase [Pseudomonadales bacterium]
MTSVGAWLAAHADLDRRDREVLLCAAAGLTRAQLISRPETPLCASVEQRLNAWAGRCRQGEPLAYVTGRKEFWGLELEVTPQVLVPRPETELLVEQALERIAARQSGPVDVLELGTGSGAVAIAIALEAASRHLAVTVTATDVSAGALGVATENARRLGACVRWIESDWFAQLATRFELIVCNPPYVSAGDPHLHALTYEPSLALVSGDDGLAALRRIAAAAPAHLHDGGWLLLEHGFEQGPAVRELLGAAGFEQIETLPDLAGLDRVTRGQLRRPRK